MSIVIKRVIYMLAAGLLVMLAAGLAIYGFKERLAVYLVNQQLSEFSQANDSTQNESGKLSLDCLSFDIKLFKESNIDAGKPSQTSLEIGQICLTLNHASVTLNNIELVWQHSDFSLSKLSDKQYWLANLKRLKVELIEVIGTPVTEADINDQQVANQTTYQQFIESIETSVADIHSHIEQLSQLVLVDVKQVRFQPQRDLAKVAYVAEVKYAKQPLSNRSGHSTGLGLLTASVSREHTEQSELLSTKIVLSPDSLAGDFTLNLAELKTATSSLFQQSNWQQLANSADLNGTFSGHFSWPLLGQKLSQKLNRKNRKLSITDLTTRLDIQNTKLELEPAFFNELAKLMTLDASSISEFTKTELAQAFSLSGDISLKAVLAESGVNIGFRKGDFVEGNFTNQIRLDLPASWRQQTLEPSESSVQTNLQDLIAFTEANQITNLSLALNNDGKITWQPNSIIGTFDTFELAAVRLALGQQSQRTKATNSQVLSADVTELSYQAQTANVNSQLNSKLTINGAVVVPQLAKLSQAPIEFKLASQLALTEELLTLDFSEGSKLALSSLSVPELATVQSIEQAVEGQIELDFTALASSTNYLPELDLKLLTSISDAQISANTREANGGKASDIGVNLANTRLESSVKVDLNQALDVQAQFSLAELDLAQVEITGDYLTPSFVVQQSSIALVDLLDKLSLSLPEEITPDLVEGQLSYYLTGQVKSWQQLLDSDMNGQFAIEQLTGRVKKYWLEGLHYQQGFSWHNQVLQSDTYVNKSTNKRANQNGLLSVDLVDVGVELKALSLQPEFVFTPQLQSWQGKLSVITGQAFNGEFSIDELEWPIAQEQTLALSFDGFDLSELIALENQQGINVTGQVSGQVPLYVAEKEGKLELSISDGNLFNITNGLIQIKDNPAVEQFKLNHQQLAIAFEALENLHYNQLSAQVNMDSQGQMLLATSIKGRNPDLDNEVNLNLNLDYDLLGLLESLQIPEQLEQRISDRLSNAKVN